MLISDFPLSLPIATSQPIVIAHCYCLLLLPIAIAYWREPLINVLDAGVERAVEAMVLDPCEPVGDAVARGVVLVQPLAQLDGPSESQLYGSSDNEV